MGLQDAKSDRVKQLLKETEKYLQKLGSKLQDAKHMARRFETDVDDSRTSTMIEKNEFSYDNEDETDQAKVSKSLFWLYCYHWAFCVFGGAYSFLICFAALFGKQ